MTETISAAQRIVNAAASVEAGRRRLTWVTGGILLALAVAVVLLRLQRLNELPPGISYGEGANGLDALRVLQGEHAIFFPEKAWGREGLVMYAIALSISLFGRTEFALRLPTALASAGTVFVVFWLGQLLFGRDEESGRATPWRGIMVGGSGAGLMAVSLGQTIMGRTAFRTSLLLFFLCLCLAFLWQGWTQRDRGSGAWWRIVVAGVCAGLLLYTYIPARLVPFLFLSYGLSFLLPLRAVPGEFDGAASQRPGIAAAFNRVRAEMPRIVVFVGVAGLVAAPILVYFALHPEYFFSRSDQVSLFAPHRSQGDPLGTFLVNVWDHVLAFGFRGDPTWRHNYAGRPMLNPMEALFFWLGVGLAVWRWQRRPAYRLLLLWLCILILPAMLARDAAPNIQRMIGAAPAVYLLIGVGMWEAFRFLEERCRVLQWRANLIFRGNETRAAIAVGVVVGALILVQGVITYRTYFQKWAAAPETYVAYQSHWTDLARRLNAQPSAMDKIYLIPVHTWYSGSWFHHGFDYLYRGTTPTPMFFKAAPNLAQKVESTLAAMESVSAVKFVDWHNENVGGGAVADKHILFLLGKYGRHLNSDAYTGFQIHTYTDIALERPWTYYDYLEPLTVHYDGGISLHGLAVGQGEEQLSSQQLKLGQERPLWIVLQWQVAPGQDIDFATSLRLRNAEGGSVYQQDAVLTNSKPASTSNWSAGELIDTLHLLEFSADLPPGEYEMRLVVYDFATLKPTVEIGVWEPETVLARLQLSEVR